MNIHVWLRYVLVTGYTDNIDEVKKLAKYIKKYPNISKVEVLPFHKFGEYKWEKLALPYELKDVEPPSKELTRQIQNILNK